MPLKTKKCRVLDEPKTKKDNEKTSNGSLAGA